MSQETDFIRLSVATEGSGSSRLVIKNLLDLLHEFWGQLLEELQGSEVVLQLLDLGSTKNDGRDIGVLCSPCQTQLGDGTTELLSDGSELSDLRDMCK